jgi:hypothetical protein
MSAEQYVGAAGRRRSPATCPGYHLGRAPRDKGLALAADANRR